VVENYPDLKANQNFLQLQGELTNTEDRLQTARRFYNANVRDYNRRVKQFPSVVVASLFNFEEEEFFEVEDAIREGGAPQVNFGAPAGSGAPLANESPAAPSSVPPAAPPPPDDDVPEPPGQPAPPTPPG
jgi:LemA protein